MSNRPKKFPEWASELVQSDQSNELNRYEPPVQKKKIGWDVGEIPPRQWVNYQANLTCKWLEYLDRGNHKAKIVLSKDKLPKAKDSKGMFAYINNSQVLAFSNGTKWQKLTTEDL